MSTKNVVSLIPQLQLDENWTQAWKYYSVWGYGIVLALVQAWPELVAAAPWLGKGDALTGVLGYLLQGIAVAGILGRIVKQTKPAAPLPAPYVER